MPVAPVRQPIDLQKASTAQLAAAVSLNQRAQDTYVRELEAVVASCLR